MLGLDEHSLRDLEAPSKEDVIYAVIGFIIGIVLLPVQVIRIYNGLQDGRLLITGNWHADWSHSTVGFVLTLIVHFGIAIMALGLIWYGVATVRHWLLEQ
ncbi:MAG: hypothetical protein V4513_10575 [Pseudomonadota bacterium]